MTYRMQFSIIDDYLFSRIILKSPQAITYSNVEKFNNPISLYANKCQVMNCSQVNTTLRPEAPGYME